MKNHTKLNAKYPSTLTGDLYSNVVKRMDFKDRVKLLSSIHSALTCYTE